MSKIIKKNDITKLVESTMIEAGLLKEGETWIILWVNLMMKINYQTHRMKFI